MQEKLIRLPGMVPIIAVFAFCMSGLSLLMPVSPAWVTAGGAGTTGAGLVTAVMMGSTVATQIFLVQRLLDRFGWAVTLVAGSLLMGLPSALQALSSDLVPVLVSSALRGIGFGILTVACFTALTVLIPVGRRGAAIGYYGLAAAVPQLIFTPLAPWMVEVLGYRPVLVGGAMTVFAVPFAWRLGRLVEARRESSVELSSKQAGGTAPVLVRIWPALLALTCATASGGAFMTFASDISADASLASIALLCVMVMGVPTRLYGGILTDKWGSRITMAPVLALNAVGVALLGFAALEEGAANVVLLLAGSLLTGLGYGFLQSVTMVRALADAGEGSASAASVAWNANFDLGTGLGGFVIGALASSLGFFGAWLFWAILMLICALTIGFRDLTRKA